MGTAFKYQTTPFNWKLKDLKDAIGRTQGIIDGTDAWTTAFMENHDQARSISRFGNDLPEWRVRCGKMLAILNTALSGTLFIYQGQELGMINLPLSVPMEDYKDLESNDYYAMVAERSGNDPEKLAEAHRVLQHLARDHSRSPMQWNSSSPNGGFSGPEATPWMKLNPYTEVINAEQQTTDSDSVLTFWKRMIRLRKQYRELFVHGIFTLLDVDNEHVFTFSKNGGEKSIQITCNFSGERRALPPVQFGQNLLVSNVENHAQDVLQPWEGRIYA